MSNLFTKLKVEPGARVNLRNMDPNYRRFHLHEAALPKIQPHIAEYRSVELPDFHEEFIVKAGDQGEAGRYRSELPGKYES